MSHVSQSCQYQLGWLEDDSEDEYYWDDCYWGLRQDYVNSYINSVCDVQQSEWRAEPSRDLQRADLCSGVMANPSRDLQRADLERLDPYPSLITWADGPEVHRHVNNSDCEDQQSEGRE